MAHTRREQAAERLTIYLPPDLRRMVKVAASGADMTLSEFCQRALLDALGQGTVERRTWQETLRIAEDLRHEIREKYGAQPDSAEEIRRLREDRDNELVP